MKSIKNTDCVVDVENKLIYSNGVELVPDSDNNITITMYDYEITKDVEWLVNIAKYGIDIPDVGVDKINSLTIQFPKYVYSERTKVLVQFKDPVYIKKHRKLYSIILYPKLAGLDRTYISKDGVIITEDGKIIAEPKNLVKTKDYPKYHIWSGTIKDFYIHRLVCIGWNYNDNYYEKYQVDHIDMNKMNFNADNLEWVSPKENQRRAAKKLSEIGEFNSPIIVARVKHKNSQEVLKFHSLAEMSRQLGIYEGTSTDYKYAKLGLLYNDYEIRVDGDERDWYYKTGDERPIPRTALNMFIVYRNNESYTFFTVSEVCKFFNKPRAKGRPALLKIVENAGYKLKVINLNVGEDKIQVLDTTINKVYEFESIKEASDFMKANFDMINKRIRYRQDDVLVNDKYLVRSKTDNPWKTPKKPNNTKPKKIKVIKLSEKELIFDSLNKASVYTGISKKTIRKHLDGGIPYNGYLFYTC